MKRDTSKKVEACQRVVQEWQLYCTRAKYAYVPCPVLIVDCFILTNNYRCLKKVFVSIKGIYFQCNIQVYRFSHFTSFKRCSYIFLNDTIIIILQGQPVTWISPHAFSQHYPKDVDFSVMITFLDFYLVSL